MSAIHDLSWWYWFLTLGLLAGGLFVQPEAILLAMALCLGQIAHVIRLTRDLTALPVQVRAVDLVMLIAGLWTLLSLKAAVPPYGAAFRRISLERVQA
jgi:hypothetical protein